MCVSPASELLLPLSLLMTLLLLNLLHPLCAAEACQTSALALCYKLLCDKPDCSTVRLWSFTHQVAADQLFPGKSHCLGTDTKAVAVVQEWHGEEQKCHKAALKS